VSPLEFGRTLHNKKNCYHCSDLWGG
jgi:hypothetical protein